MGHTQAARPHTKLTGGSKMRSKAAIRTTLFLLAVVVLVASNLVGCGESKGVAQPKQGSAANCAQENFGYS